MTYNDALRSFTRHESMLTLAHVTGKSPTEIALNPLSVLSEGQEENFLALLNARQEHVPLQYLLGRWQFMGLDFIVNPHVLIPRQDTEVLAEAAIQANPKRVLDLCTGSGCVAISLARYTDAVVTAADISPGALAVARQNAALNGVSERVCFIESDLFQQVSGPFDMIVSNPPYIPSGEMGALQDEVKNHEPRLALDGGADGMNFYRRIIAEAKDFLTPGGSLYLEAGGAAGIRSLLAAHGFAHITTLNDLTGLERVVYARKEQPSV